MIEEWLDLRSDVVNIGAMNGYDGNYLDKHDDSLIDDNAPTTKDTIEDAVKELGDEEDMDDFFASSVHGGSEDGIDAKHLSKVWCISHEDAKWTIDATTQHGTHLPNPAMNQNYTTNDQMLRYRRINQYFFMDTFFVTRKGGTSSRGNTCCQLFIMDKGFIYVVTMKRKTNTGSNEVDNNETATSKRHIDIEDSVDSQGRLMNQLPAYDRLLNANSILRGEIGKYFELREASIGPPKTYLGTGKRKVKLDNRLDAWAASSSQYVQAAVRNVEEYVEKSQDK